MKRGCTFLAWSHSSSAVPKMSSPFFKKNFLDYLESLILCGFQGLKKLYCFSEWQHIHPICCAAQQPRNQRRQQLPERQARLKTRTRSLAHLMEETRKAVPICLYSRQGHDARKTDASHLRPCYRANRPTQGRQRRKEASHH